MQRGVTYSTQTHIVATHKRHAFTYTYIVEMGSKLFVNVNYEYINARRNNGVKIRRKALIRPTTN